MLVFEVASWFQNEAPGERGCVGDQLVSLVRSRLKMVEYEAERQDTRMMIRD